MVTGVILNGWLLFSFGLLDKQAQIKKGAIAGSLGIKVINPIKAIRMFLLL